MLVTSLSAVLSPGSSAVNVRVDVRPRFS